MDDLRELLRESAASPRTELDLDDVRQRAVRVRRNQRLLATLPVAALVALVAVLGWSAWKALGPDRGVVIDQPSPQPTAPASERAPSEPESPHTTAPPPEPLDGWARLPVDPTIFGQVRITDAAADGQRLVLAGCEQFSSTSTIPMWWSDDAETWRRASWPELLGPGCVRQVESTRFGFYAIGPDAGSVMWSADGEEWEPVQLPDAGSDLGLPVFFPSPSGDRVTILKFPRGDVAESTDGALFTTTDGHEWEEGPADSAALFDDSTIADVIPGGDGLLAVGSSPGGEFVPTAAVFTSADGLTWRRVTPRNADFDEKMMTAVMDTGDGFVAVGGDLASADRPGAGLMAAWTSPDGITWTPSSPPDEETDASVAHMTAQAVTQAGGAIWAAGRDFDARRDDEDKERPALWVSEDGQAWVRADLEDNARRTPFIVLDLPDLRLGVWPPPIPYANPNADPGPVELFVAE